MRRGGENEREKKKGGENEGEGSEKKSSSTRLVQTAIDE